MSKKFILLYTLFVLAIVASLLIAYKPAGPRPETQRGAVEVPAGRP